MNRESLKAATESLPTHIARMLRALLTEPSARLQLWASFELSEMTLRWLFAVALSEIHTRTGKLPKKLAKQIRQQIFRPTMGGWAAMAIGASRSVLKGPPSLATPFAELVLLNARKPESYWSPLVNLRNDFVHGGGVTEKQAEQQLVKVMELLSPVLVSLAEIHDSLEVWGIYNKTQYLLRGPESLVSENPHSLAIEVDDTWLVGADGARLSLKPLLVYEPVFEDWENDEVQSPGSKSRPPVTQSYFRFYNDRLFYTPIGVDDFISVTLNVEKFRSLFPPLEPTEEKYIHGRQLEGARSRLRTAFVGRFREKERIREWIRENEQGSGLIGLVYGAAGIGKSALMGSLANEMATRLRDTGSSRRAMVYHSFSAEDPHNDRRLFLLNLYEQLKLWTNDEPSSKVAALTLSQLQEATVTELRRALGHSEAASLRILIDGLDEIANQDSKFPEMLVDLAEERVLIVASTRKERFMQAFDASKDVEAIRFGDTDELPPMEDQDIRGMLIDGLGPRGQEIISFDIDDTSGPAGSIARNAYITKVVEHADGKPIYIELLVKDILANNTIIDPKVRLPASLEGFYSKVLAQQGLSDAKSHVALLVCLLAVSKEALSESVLVALFSLMPGAQFRDSQNLRWVRAALGQAEVFVTEAETPEGGRAYVLYHQRFREFVEAGSQGPDSAGRGAQQLRWALDFSKWLLVKAAEDGCEGKGEEARRHILRHGAEYLLQWGGDLTPFGDDFDPEKVALAEYLSESRLAEVYDAWRSNGEAFLRWFTRVLSIMSPEQQRSSQDAVVDGLFQFVVDGDHGGRLTSGVVQGALAYSTDAEPFYARMLELATGEEGAQRFARARDPLEQVRWIADAGGAYRRKGETERAAKHLSEAARMLDELKEAPEQGLERLRSLINYERGYLAYIQADVETATQWFTESLANAERAGHAVGARIALAVRGIVGLRAGHAAGKDVSGAAKAFREAMAREKESLLLITRSEAPESDRLHAERWVMNCRAHAFDSAVLAADGEAARHAYEELEQDAWMRASLYSEKASILSIRRAQYLALEGDLVGAEKAYAAELPPIQSLDDPNTKIEGAAQRYLDHARVLRSLGRTNDALRAIEFGLMTQDRFANGLWKPALKLLKAELLSEQDTN